MVIYTYISLHIRVYGFRIGRRQTYYKLGAMQLTKTAKIVLSTLAALCVAAAVAFALGAKVIGTYLAAPVLFLSGWAFVGHLITADDDMPGEWSNPEGSRSLWHRSLVQLIVKFVIFAVLGLLVASQWTSA